MALESTFTEQETVTLRRVEKRDERCEGAEREATCVLDLG
jgi:hypothetical protein